MASEMVAYNLNIQPGWSIKLIGDIPPNAKQFKLNLGRDFLNIALHINPRFSYKNDNKVILYGSMLEGFWTTMHKEFHFPFVPGKEMEIYITFDGKHFIVKLPGGFQFSIQNHLNLPEVNYLQTWGDFKVRKVAFE